MPDEQEIERRFWSALRSDMTVMLGIDGTFPRPMTAQVEDEDRGPIWFFTSRKSELVSRMAGGCPGWMTFTDKGQNLWASVKGRLSVSNDPAVVDRLWSPFIAAWFDGGKSDPDLVLLRFDPADAEIWIDGSSFLAGLKMLLGSDPKEDYKDNVARVTLN